MIRPLDIQTPYGLCDAWLALPDGEGTWPGVIFCMDAGGPRTYMCKMAERLASQGFAVLLPNLFYRQKRAPLAKADYPIRTEESLGIVLEQIMPLVHGYKPEEGLEDMQIFLDVLAEQPQTKAGPFGITGYCMGGSIAVRTAAHFPDRFAALTSFHAGGLVTPEASSPHKLLPKLKADLYFAHADQDPHMTSEQIAEFERALRPLTVAHESEIYAGAQHGFTMADLPPYNVEASERHWQKTFEQFERLRR